MGVGIAVRFDMMLGCVLGMFGGMDMMPMGEMRMVRSSFMVPFAVMPCGFAVVTRSVLVMLRCLGMMMCSFV